MLLCGMLAADFASVSEKVRDALHQASPHARGLAGQGAGRGRRDGNAQVVGDAQTDARSLFAALGRARLLAPRLFQPLQRIRMCSAAVRADVRRSAAG